MPFLTRHLDRRSTRNVATALALGVALSFTALPVLAEERTGTSAAQGNDATERTVTVSGHGEASAKPDMAETTLGVVAVAETAADAISKVNEAMGKIVSAAKKQGIDAKDLQTTAFSIDPRYRDNAGGGQNGIRANGDEQKPAIIGYEARMALQVTIRDIDKTGAVLDQAIKLGANQTSGIDFTLSDPEKLRRQAQSRAVEDARHSAERLAKAAGTGLGKVRSIVDQSGPSTPRPMVRMNLKAMAASEAPMSVESGESSVSADVTLVFDLKD